MKHTSVLNSLMVELTIVLAGGFIRDIIIYEPVNDIDLWIIDDGQIGKTIHEAENILGTPIKKTSYSNTWVINTSADNSISVQLTLKFTPKSVDDLIDYIDFTVCKAVIYYDKETGLWSSSCHDCFYEDLKNKLVRIIPQPYWTSEKIAGSLHRLLKFHKKGFLVPLETLAQVATLAVSTSLNDDSNLYDSLQKAVYEVPNS